MTEDSNVTDAEKIEQLSTALRFYLSAGSKQQRAIAAGHAKEALRAAGDVHPSMGRGVDYGNQIAELQGQLADAAAAQAAIGRVTECKVEARHWDVKAGDAYMLADACEHYQRDLAEWHAIHGTENASEVADALKRVRLERDEARTELAAVEKERDELNEKHVAINRIGATLLEPLAKFVRDTIEKGHPLTTTIICDVEDLEPKTVLYLWATTDEKEPTARVHELATSKSAAIARADDVEKQLAAALERERGLREALEEIAGYDLEPGGRPGICPYGCDTPHIARAALAEPKP